MNSSYTYINGKAIIFDENGNQVPINYYNNLDDVLVQAKGRVKTLPFEILLPSV